MWIRCICAKMFSYAWDSVSILCLYKAFDSISRHFVPFLRILRYLEPSLGVCDVTNDLFPKKVFYEFDLTIIILVHINLPIPNLVQEAHKYP